MNAIIPAPRPVPDFWNVYAHSWFQFVGGSRDQTGRVDSLFRSAMDIEWGSWRNYALSGARVCANGQALGGWTRLVAYRGLPGRTGPYAPEGGASVLCWGINDMGQYGGQNTATRQTIVDTLRACISRCRASTILEDNSGSFTWSNWTNLASGLDLCSGGTTRQCTVTTANNGTFTIPADYKGEPIALAFLLRPGSTGGTVTFSGTAGVTGTFATGGGGQSSTEHAYTIKRITNLTSANAGQTIIITCTALDATAPAVFFDCAWLESLTPPPVIICDVAKLTLAGYYNAFYNTWSVTGTRSEANMDADVDALNTLLYAMVAEFDSMVQVAACDAAIAKNATLTSDGIHPNEFGAGKVVDALIDARNRLTPPGTATSATLGHNGPAERASSLRRPHLTGYYHASDLTSQTFSVAAPGTAGDEWAVPFPITEARETYMRIGLLCTTVGTVGATVRWAIYDDPKQVGYPQQLITGMDPTSGGAATIGITPAAPSVRDSANLNSGFGFAADPNLYWIVLKLDTAGTGQQWQFTAGQSPWLPTRPTTGLGTALNCAWKLTGQGTGALPGTFPAGATLSAGPVPLLQLFRSS